MLQPRPDRPWRREVRERDGPGRAVRRRDAEPRPDRDADRAADLRRATRTGSGPRASRYEAPRPRCVRIYRAEPGTEALIAEPRDRLRGHRPARALGASTRTRRRSGRATRSSSSRGVDRVRRARGGAVTPLGVGLLWPILFLIPGWIVVRRVAPGLPAPGAVGVAVVASVYLSAHVVDGVARLVGFGLPAVVGLGRADRRGERRARGRPASVAGALPRTDPQRRRIDPSRPRRHLGGGDRVRRRSSATSCSATAGERVVDCSSRADGTGATCWSTWPSGRASSTATSRPRCPTSPGSR